MKENGAIDIGEKTDEQPASLSKKEKLAAGAAATAVFGASFYIGIFGPRTDLSRSVNMIAGPDVTPEAVVEEATPEAQRAPIPEPDQSGVIYINIGTPQTVFENLQN